MCSFNSPLVCMYNHNLVISKPGLTGSNKLNDMPWLFCLQVPFTEFKKKSYHAVRSPNKTSEKRYRDKNEWAIGNMLPVGQILTMFPTPPASEDTALMWGFSSFVFFPLCNGCSMVYSFCIIQKHSINKINTEHSIQTFFLNSKNLHSSKTVFRLISTSFSV